MTISVVIPCYNRPVFVKDAIESVFRQTYQQKESAVEIIVVDDGSVPALALSAYHPRISLIRTEQNRGVSAARNAGARAAKGKFIAFLDSDDLWLADKLEKQIRFMEERGALVSHTDEFWLRQGKWVNQGNKHLRYGGDILCHILDKCRVSPSSLMMRTDFFRELGGFDESLRVCEDYDLCLRIAARAEIQYLESKLLVKRAIDKESLSASIRHIESVRLEILEHFAATDAYDDRYNACIQAELERKRKIVKNVI